MSDKRSNIRLVGLEYLQFGDVESSGSFPGATSLNTIGNVVPDSAHFVIEMPGVTDLFIEEADTPDIQIFGNSKKYVEFAVRDMGTKTLIHAFGGAAAAAAYSFPVTSLVYQEQAVFAQSKTINGKKLKIEIPRASIAASGDLKFARTDSGTLAFVCNILLPNSSTAISPCVITQV